MPTILMTALMVLAMAQCAVIVHLVMQGRRREQESDVRLAKVAEEHVRDLGIQPRMPGFRSTVSTFGHTTGGNSRKDPAPSIGDLVDKFQKLYGEDNQIPCMVARVKDDPEKIAFIVGYRRAYVSAVDLESVIRTKSDNGELRYEIRNDEPHVSLPMGEERAYVLVEHLLQYVPGAEFTDTEISDWAEGLNPEMFKDE